MYAVHPLEMNLTGRNNGSDVDLVGSHKHKCSMEGGFGDTSRPNGVCTALLMGKDNIGY